jgi:hypothetical protein
LAAIIRDDRDRLSVVARQHALDHITAFRPEGDPIPDLELEHLGVCLHLLKEAEAFDDPMVEVDEFRFGQLIDVDPHEFSSSRLNQVTTSGDPDDPAKVLSRSAPESPFPRPRQPTCEVSLRRRSRSSDGGPAGGLQFQGRSSSMRFTGGSGSRASTSASQACGSTPLSLQVSIRV